MPDSKLNTHVRFLKDKSPMIVVGANSGDGDANVDLFLYFLQLLSDKERTFQVNLDPFYEEVLKDTEIIPEEFKDKDIKEIPKEYKKTMVYLGISLEEIIPSNNN